MYETPNMLIVGLTLQKKVKNNDFFFSLNVHNIILFIFYLVQKQLNTNKTVNFLIA